MVLPVPGEGDRAKFVVGSAVCAGHADDPICDAYRQPAGQIPRSCPASQLKSDAGYLTSARITRQSPTTKGSTTQMIVVTPSWVHSLPDRLPSLKSAF